jgi:RNA-directed DNA polymerase
MRTRYALDQSPLYKLQRRQGLAELLFLPLNGIEELANADPPPYKFFSLPGKNNKKKARHIEWPNRGLQRVQRRLVQLLDRIAPPGYIHSGFRGRSYITNAREHKFNVRLAKIDIRKFFPSSSAKHVVRCFSKTFHCSSDVSTILTKLMTIMGHLPTGGSSSSILSFYAYKPMFDEINELAASRGLVMSCCVDDMTFSGEKATRGFLNEVRMIVSRYGLKTHKYHCFERSQAKVVTGVALTPNGIKLPNARRKKLHETFSDFDRETNPDLKATLGEKLLGRVTEAAQVEDRFKPLIQPVSEKLNAIRRANQKQNT